MANRVFQSVIYQMKDAINRVVGVVDETGAVISCSELNLIGEVRDGFVAERLTAGDHDERMILGSLHVLGKGVRKNL